MKAGILEEKACEVSKVMRTTRNKGEKDVRPPLPPRIVRTHTHKKNESIGYK